MKKRIFAAFTATVMTVSMFSSCNNQTSVDTAIADTTVAEATTALVTTIPAYFGAKTEPVAAPYVKSEYVDYASALQQSLYFYDANMCGTEVGEHAALDWRDDCHTYDVFEYNGQEVDLTGGFHDAGDHVKFGLPAAYSAFTLGYSYHLFPEAYTETKQDAHLKEITDHFAEYFRKCAIYEDGKVVAFCYQVGTGGGEADHGYWGSPEEQPEVGANGYVRDAYFSDDKNINADIVSATIAALTINYINFGNEEDLKVAIDLHNYLEQFTDMIVNDLSDDTDDIEIVSTVPEYPRWESIAYPNSPWDYLCLGEYALNLATDTDDYTTIMNAKLTKSPRFWDNNGGYSDYPVGWDGIWPYVGFLAKELGAERAEAVLFSRIKDKNLVIGNKYVDFTKPDVYGYVDEWGSARRNAAFQFTGLAYEKFTEADDSLYAIWAVGQMDYLFGKNDNNQAFMIGYNYRGDVNYPAHPHHRASSSPAYGNQVTGNGTKEQSHILVGALVGGPQDADGTYEDTAENYITNEVALDYNAGFVAALAGLYSKYENTGTQVIVNPPSSIAVGVEDTYAY
jgi:hypothetical protein